MSLNAVMCRDIYWTALRVRQPQKSEELKALTKEIYEDPDLVAEEKDLVEKKVLFYREKVFNILNQLTFNELKKLRRMANHGKHNPVLKANAWGDFINFVINAMTVKEHLIKNKDAKFYICRILENKDPYRARIALIYCGENLNSSFAEFVIKQLKKREDRVARTLENALAKTFNLEIK